MDDSILVGETTKADILYLTMRTKQHPKEIMAMINPQLVVISPNMDWKSKNYWVSLLKDKGVPIHDLRNEGALVYSSI